MTIVSVTEARDGFADLVNRAGYAGERILVSRRGRPIAAIVPAEDVAILEMIENELDMSAGRAALSDSSNAHALDWNEVRAQLGR